MNNKRAWNTQVHEPHRVSALSDVFLSELVTELDNDAVTAIILRGNYARGHLHQHMSSPRVSSVFTRLFLPPPSQQKRGKADQLRLLPSNAQIHELRHYRVLAQERKADENKQKKQHLLV